ncbi:hypothetical protein B0T21DRAFT_127872 [Apiosordaria backusii]|uniref:Uncharacterized protein n=1 Tax=Apiosordaria backusii TaxID=314023 RepID=A0AA40EMY3_9PEZI|nr:hypothetical protein B0T21DRAFT_127872 [Apiosordaria backusii]
MLAVHRAIWIVCGGGALGVASVALGEACNRFLGPILKLKLDGPRSGREPFCSAIAEPVSATLTVIPAAPSHSTLPIVWLFMQAGADSCPDSWFSASCHFARFRDPRAKESKAWGADAVFCFKNLNCWETTVWITSPYRVSISGVLGQGSGAGGFIGSRSPTTRMAGAVRPSFEITPITTAADASSDQNHAPRPPKPHPVACWPLQRLPKCHPGPRRGTQRLGQLCMGFWARDSTVSAMGVGRHRWPPLPCGLGPGLFFGLCLAICFGSLSPCGLPHLKLGKLWPPCHKSSVIPSDFTRSRPCQQNSVDLDSTQTLWPPYPDHWTMLRVGGPY